MKIRKLPLKDKTICSECPKGRYARIEYTFRGMDKPLKVCHFCAENILRRTGDVLPSLKGSNLREVYYGDK